METSMVVEANAGEGNGHESDRSLELLKPTVYTPPANTSTRRRSSPSKVHQKVKDLTDEQLAALQAGLFEQAREKLTPTRAQPADAAPLTDKNLIKYLEAELTKAKTYIAQLEGQEAAAVDQAMQAREEKASVQQLVTKLRPALQRRDQSIQRLQERNGRLEIEVREQRRTIAQQEGQIQRMTDEYYSVQFQHAQTTEFHTKVVNRLQLDVDTLKGVVEEAKKFS